MARLDADEGIRGAAPYNDSVTTLPPLLDQLGRPVRDLRISITDRCNFRCVYCMPKTVFGRDYPFLPRADLDRKSVV
jgi:hypothetical protein